MFFPYERSVFPLKTLELRSHTPKGRAARDKILRAAEKLLAARGFHGTSMRDVAEAAGVPLASAMYHFAKKEQLHGAVLETIAEELQARLDAALAGSVQYEEKLEALLRALLAWGEAKPARVKLLLRELLDNPTRVAQAWKLPLAPVLRLMTELIEDGVRRRILHVDGPAEVAVLHVVGAVSYFVAARPTVERILGEERSRVIEETYARDALAFAKRALGGG